MRDSHMRFLRAALLTLGFLGLLLGTPSNAFAADSLEVVPTSPSRTAPLVRNYTNSGNSFRFAPRDINESKDSKAADVLSTFKVGGYARWVTYYRHLSNVYPDYTGKSRGFEFEDYKTDPATGQNQNIPTIEISLSARPAPTFEFTTGFSLSHTFTGQGGDTARTAATREFLNFGGKYTSSVGTFSLRAGGGILWSTMSPLTMAQLQYRDDPFARLPWDWYSSSWEKYEMYYNTTNFIGAQGFGGVAMQGIAFEAEGLPLGFSAKTFYGRHNNGIEAALVDERWPSYTFGQRVSKSLGQHSFAVNYYLNRTNVSQNDYGQVHDIRRIVTGEAQLRLGSVKGFVEAGAGFTENPSYEADWDPSIYTRWEMPRLPGGIDLTASGYYIGLSTASLISQVNNSNPAVVNGGYPRTDQQTYNTTLFVNMAQESHQLANNRVGGMIRLEKDLGRLHIVANLAASQQIEEKFDTVTFQHRASAFVRSRLTPFIQNSGPYGRNKSTFRQSFEFLAINRGDNTDKLGFNTADINFKYKTRVFNRDLILTSFTSATSVQYGFSPVPKFTNAALVRTVYQELMAYLRLDPKVTLVGMFSIEHAWGNEDTDLSPDNGKPLDQQHETFGVGLDYDFATNAGLYLRQQWFYQEDKNFSADHLQGGQTSIELKVFF